MNPKARQILEMIKEAGAVAGSANSILELRQRIQHLMQSEQVDPKQLEGSQPPNHAPSVLPNAPTLQRTTVDPPRLQRTTVTPGGGQTPPYGFLGLDLSGRWGYVGAGPEILTLLQYGPGISGRGTNEWTGFAGEGIVNPLIGAVLLNGQFPNAVRLWGELRHTANGTLFGTMNRDWPNGARDQIQLHLIRLGYL